MSNVQQKRGNKIRFKSKVQTLSLMSDIIEIEDCWCDRVGSVHCAIQQNQYHLHMKLHIVHSKHTFTMIFDRSFSRLTDKSCLPCVQHITKFE